MRPSELLKWPPSCSTCDEPIAEWMSAGYDAGRWMHRKCWLDSPSSETRADGASLSSPLEGVRHGLPMILFLLLFHFGGGAAIMGWFMLTQFEGQSSALIVLLAGVVGFLLGLGGFAVEVVMRRRAELIRQELERQGGWQPIESQ